MIDSDIISCFGALTICKTLNAVSIKALLALTAMTNLLIDANGISVALGNAGFPAGTCRLWTAIGFRISVNRNFGRRSRKVRLRSRRQRRFDRWWYISRMSFIAANAFYATRRDVFLPAIMWTDSMIRIVGARRQRWCFANWFLSWIIFVSFISVVDVGWNGC